MWDFLRKKFADTRIIRTFALTSNLIYIYHFPRGVSYL